MRAFYSLIFVFLCCLSCQKTWESSTPNNDPNTQDSVVVWIDAVRQNNHLDNATRDIYLDKAYKTTIARPVTRVNGDLLCKLAYLQLTYGDSTTFKKVNNTLLQMAKEHDFYDFHGLAHWNFADFLNNTKPDSSYYHFKEAYLNFSKANLEDKKRDYPGRMLYAMASIKENTKDYVGAEKDAVAALAFFKKIDKKEQLFSTYNLLAVIQNGLGKYDKALAYHDKAKAFIGVAPPKKQNSYKIRNANNIAYTHLRSEDYSKAFALFSQLAEQKSMATNNLVSYGKVLASKAYSAHKIGNGTYKNNLLALRTSTQIFDSLGKTYEQARNYQYMAEILAHAGDTAAAINNGLMAKSIAEETSNNDRLLSVLALLTQLDEIRSVAHAKTYFNLAQKLQQEERTIQDKFARIQMETEEIVQKNESLAQRTELLAGISIGLLVLGVGVFTIVLQRISNQRLRFQQRQQETNQEIYNLMLVQHGKMEEGKKMEQKRVSEELHDGILGDMLGIRLILDGLNERDDAAAIAQRGALLGKLKEVEEEIRTISHELNNAASNRVDNFILSIEELIRTVEQSSKMNIHFDYDSQFDWDKLLTDIKINGYRVIQELLQNCVKHAQCKNVEVTFLNPQNMLILRVVDDGVGFVSSKGKRGIGLKNIKSRVNKMGAELEIDSKPSQGTSITVTIPNIDVKSRNNFKSSKQTIAIES